MLELVTVTPEMNKDGLFDEILAIRNQRSINQVTSRHLEEEDHVELESWNKKPTERETSPMLRPKSCATQLDNFVPQETPAKRKVSNDTLLSSTMMARQQVEAKQPIPLFKLN